MPMHRKNKAPRLGDQSATERWFDNNVNRSRRREELAIKSRRRNRR